LDVSFNIIPYIININTIMKNTIYIILLVLLSLSMKWIADYPSILFIAGIGWCVAGFLLIRSILRHLTNKK
jgi:hypothetical protein